MKTQNTHNEERDLINKVTIIDFLNIKSMYYILVNERKSNIVIMFHSQSKIIEFILKKVITIFSISVVFEKLDFGNIDSSVFNKVFKSTSDIVNQNTDINKFPNKTKIDKYFRYEFKSLLFRSLWRPISILVYTRKMYYNKVENIYLSLPYHIYINDEVVNIIKKDDINIHCYRSSCNINDNGYVFQFRKTKLSLLGVHLEAIIVSLKHLLFISIRKNIKSKSFDIILFSHYKEREAGFQNGSKFLEMSKYNHCIVRGDVIGTYSNENKFRIRSLYYGNIFLYIAHYFAGIFNFFWVLKNYPLLFIGLMNSWIDMYLLDKLFNEAKPKIVCSNYETYLSQVALALASDSKEISSFAAIWSLGYRPTDIIITNHKFVDRLFIWGDWHYELFSESNDHSSGYIVTGYIGDIFLTNMLKKAKVIEEQFRVKYSNIISVYDTTVADDLFFNNKFANSILEIVLNVAIDTNSVVVVKTKHGANVYSDLEKKYKNRLIFDYDKASLVPAFSADIVIGVQNSTLVSMASAYGKSSIFLVDDFLWERWYRYSPHNYITELHDLDHALRDTLSNPERKITDFEFVDPFCDGKAQERMSEYIDEVILNFSGEKKHALACADEKYMSHWGENTVIKSKLISKYAG